MIALGISIAIDDFGTEYSSLSRLHTLPVDRLKIDRQFVWEFSKGKTGHDILKTIFSLGEAPGLKTTAEGVETEEQLTFVRSMGCDEVQGYYYKPMPAEEIEKILEQSMNH
ncbi:MAG: EAL domain-containing protein [Thermoclostridium sp.]|nr:EAL domain-containing protein [Thermoclostridium sp.]